MIHSFQVFLLMHKESTKVGRQSTWMLSGLSDNYLLTFDHFSLWTKSLYNFVAKCLPQLVEKGSEFKPSIVQLLFFLFWDKTLTLIAPPSTHEYKWVLMNCQ